MTPEFAVLVFGALTSVVGAAFTFLLRDRSELKTTIKEMTAAAAAANAKNELLADQVPGLLVEIEMLRRGRAT